MNLRARIPSRFGVAALVLSAMYILYLIFCFDLTISSKLNIFIAIIALFTMLLLLYYLGYRYSFQELRKTKFHNILKFGLSTFLIAASIAILFTASVRLRYAALNMLGPFFSFLKFSDEVLLVYDMGLCAMSLFFYTIISWLLILLLLMLIKRVIKLPDHLIRSKLLINISLFIFLTTLATVVFGTDLFQILLGYKSTIFYGGTEEYITDRLLKQIPFLTDLQENGGFNYYRSDLGNICYFSQTGLYGTLLKLAQWITKIRPDLFIVVSRRFMAFLSAITFAVMALHLKKNLGVIASIIFYSCIIFSYWIIGPSKHLIWFYFILYLPYLFALIFYPRVLKGKMKFDRYILWNLVIFILVFLRGYTYISNLILSTAIPVLFYEILRRQPIKKIFKRCLLVCLIGLAAFVIVFLINYLQLSLYLRSFQESLSFFFEKTEFRTVGPVNATYPEIFTKWLSRRMFYFGNFQDVLLGPNSALLSGINSLGAFHIGFGVIVLISWTFYLLSKTGIIKTPIYKAKIERQFFISLAGLAAMLSSWTWFLAKNHMYYHPHMNGIMYMIPFGITCYILLGGLIQMIFDFIESPETSLPSSAKLEPT
jgi:hypothetical protein